MIRFNEHGQGYFYFAEFEKAGTTTTTKTATNKIPVAKHLTDNEYKMFLEVYANHNRSMGFEERKKYNLSNIVKIIRNKKGLKVFYENGDWWYYTPQGTWY